MRCAINPFVCSALSWTLGFVCDIRCQLSLSVEPDVCESVEESSIVWGGGAGVLVGASAARRTCASSPSKPKGQAHYLHLTYPSNHMPRCWTLD